MRKQISNPSVSVVIPTFNRAEDLRRCLESLVAQTFDNFEVLVCDDGSSDGSATVAEEFETQLDIQFETAENFGGPARPRNRGIVKARAPYIAFLDSDDWWTSTKLSRCVGAMDAGADVVYHHLYSVRSIGQSRFNEKVISTDPKYPMFAALLCTGMSVPNSSAVVRKSLLNQIGGISENRELISVEDYDTWIRLARLTEKFVRIPEYLGYYWLGGGNISAASPRQMTRIRALYAQYIDELATEQRRRAEGFLAYRIGRIAQLHGDFAAATEHLWNALRQPIDLIYRAKAGYFLTRCLLARRFS